MEPFTIRLDVMDDKWNANGNLLVICGNPGFFNQARWRHWGLISFLFFSLACTPLLPILHPSLVSSTVPVIWNNGEGGGRFIRADKWTQKQEIMADPSDYGNNLGHVCPPASILLCGMEDTQLSAKLKYFALTFHPLENLCHCHQFETKETKSDFSCAGLDGKLMP